MAKPAVFDLDPYRGDTGRWQFRLWTDRDKTEPFDVAGATADAMIKDKAPGGTIWVVMTCTVAEPNVIDMKLTADQARVLPETGIWDLQLTYPDGAVLTVLRGGVKVTQDVTFTEAAPAAPQRRFATR